MGQLQQIKTINGMLVEMKKRMEVNQKTGSFNQTHLFKKYIHVDK